MFTPSRSHGAAFALCALAGASLQSAAFAGESAPGKSAIEKEVLEEKTWCERLWELPTIYKNEESSFLNEFRFVGRAHFDVYHLDSDLGYDSDWIVRRLRFGGKAKLFQRMTLHVETELNAQDPDPLYSRLTDAYLAWKFSDAVNLTVGKHGAKFTGDGATSSNELMTIDRNNVANNLWFPTEYFSGVSLNGKLGQWMYNVGFFSGGSESPEFGNFDAGNFGLASVGYDFGKALGVKKALLRADYVYNDAEPTESPVRSFEQIGALVFQFDAGRWGFNAEVDAAQGQGTQSDVFGANVMPWFNITKQLQAVARYTYLTSDEARGVRLARYDSAITSRRGDEYQEIYGGLNYYVCGHRLKLQTGVSYVSLDDTSVPQGEYHAWQWTSGLRISF